MTTIICTPTRILADRKAYAGNSTPHMKIGLKPKIFTNGKLVMAGTSAVVGACNALYEEVIKLDTPTSALPSMFEKVTAVMVTINGTYYYCGGPCFVEVETDDKSIFIGSGADFAQGAVEAGATEEFAMAVACKFDPYTGEEIDIMTFDFCLD